MLSFELSHGVRRVTKALLVLAIQIQSFVLFVLSWMLGNACFRGDFTKTLPTKVGFLLAGDQNRIVTQMHDN